MAWKQCKRAFFGIILLGSTLISVLFPLASSAANTGREVDLYRTKVAISPQLGMAFPGKNPKFYTLLSEAGMGVVRLSVPWLYIEPEDGNYQWDSLDDRINALQRLQIEPFLTFESNSPWATDRKTWKVGNATPNNMKQWRRFVSAVAERYDADGFDDMPGIVRPVWYFQVANEWISPKNRSGGWAGTTKELITYINTAYNAVKAHAPESIFVLGGVASFNLDVMLLSEGLETFLVQQRWSETTKTTISVRDAQGSQIRSVLENHVRPVFRGAKYDMADAHLYGPEDRDAARLQEVSSKGRSVPVLSSECGGPSLDYKDDYQPKDHFYAVVERNLNVLAQGAAFCLWFGLGEEMETSWGNRKVPLYDLDRKPKPGYFGYKYLAVLFNGAVKVDQVDSSDQIYRVTHAGIGEDVYVSFEASQADLVKKAGGYPQDVVCISDPVNGKGRFWQSVSKPVSCEDGLIAVSRALPALR